MTPCRTRARHENRNRLIGTHGILKRISRRGRHGYMARKRMSRWSRDDLMQSYQSKMPSSSDVPNGLAQLNTAVTLLANLSRFFSTSSDAPFWFLKCFWCFSFNPAQFLLYSISAMMNAVSISNIGIRAILVRNERYLSRHRDIKISSTDLTKFPKLKTNGGVFYKVLITNSWKFNRVECAESFHIFLMENLFLFGHPLETKNTWLWPSSLYFFTILKQNLTNKNFHASLNRQYTLNQ